MTGSRPPRGGRDPWRGGRPTGQADPHGHGGSSRDPELEELPGLPVAARRDTRLGVGATVAALVVVALLAAGFGLLGGRPEPSPSPSAGQATEAAGGPTPPPRSHGEPTREPLVTPASDCGFVAFDLPPVYLESGPSRVAGTVELIGAAGAGVVLPTRPPDGTGTVGPRVEVRPDAVTELWIENGVCALAWVIELYDPLTKRVDALDAMLNPNLDRAYASQNRFNISNLAAFRGLDRDLELRAVLTFPRVRAQATWAVRILPLDWPGVTLRGERAGVIPVADGCDVHMNLGNGWSEQPPGIDCGDDLATDLEPPVRVRPGERLELRLDGWTVTNALVVCGHPSGRAFIAEPTPACWHEITGPATFRAPEDRGGWTLQVSACSTQDGSLAANGICGSWYANIEVR